MVIEDLSHVYWARQLPLVVEMASVVMAKVFINHSAYGFECGIVARAARVGKVDMVVFLLSLGADPDELVDEYKPLGFCGKDDKMGSALNEAIAHGYEDVVEGLLERGADVGLEDGNGRVPVGVAREMGNSDVVAMLVRRGAIG